MLEDEEVREKEGKEMEILKLATDKVKDVLQDYHTYEDKKVDRPFLTPETVVDKDNE